MTNRKPGQCAAVDATGAPCVLITAHGGPHARDRAYAWTDAREVQALVSPLWDLAQAIARGNAGAVIRISYCAICAEWKGPHAH